MSWLILLLALPSNFALNLTVFPSNFLFGAATSAYQIEGAWNVSGKSASIWDTGTHLNASFIEDHTNGDIACNSYNKIKEDVAMLKLLKVNGYRFSLSWPRLFPMGYAIRANPDGVRYYNELITELLANNIQPWVTIYHWDLPQNLQDLNGWTNPLLANVFLEFADKVFQLFGDRVKLWYTVNEPANHCKKGYGGVDAPFARSDGRGVYQCVHNLIRGHAKVYRLYESKYKKSQKGQVGIVLDSNWYEPQNADSLEDHVAAEQYMHMYFGWIAHPIFSQTGDYPSILRNRIDSVSKIQGLPTSRLPIFTDAEIREICGSSDFMGLNHYSSRKISSRNAPVSRKPNYRNDMNVIMGRDYKWELTGMPGSFVTPSGISQTLKWIAKHYGIRFKISITENGYAGFQNDGLHDYKRVDYMKKYLKEVLQAMNDGCNVTSYIVWSLMDNFEWSFGYTIRFGLFHVDFSNLNRTRQPKLSALAFRRIIETRHYQ